MANRIVRFFRELKKRKVYRVATVYAITGWIIVEVSDTIFPHLGLPEWSVSLIVILVLVGFPVAVIFSWIYDVGPQGLVKTSSVEAEQNPLPPSKRKPFTSTLTIGILLVLLVGQFIYFELIRKGGRGKVPETVRKEKVAVAPFNNFTGNENLSAFGLMASDWITSGLRELKVQTSSPEMMRRHKDNVGILPGNPENEVSLFELTGASYVITGSYYIKGDQMEVSSRLESTETGDVIYNFPAVSGPLDQKEDLVDEVRERIKGYWAVKKAEDLSHYSPPTYEAYRALVECDDFGDINCHLHALSLDTTFMLARVYLYYSSTLWDMDSVHDATGRYIREHWDECTEFEKNYTDFVDHIKQQRYEAAAKALDKNVQLDPKDLLAINESAHTWLAINRPDVALERLQPVFDQFEIFRSSLESEIYHNYLDALNRVGKSGEVVALNGRLEEEDYLRMGGHGRIQLVRALLKEGEWEQLEALMIVLRKNNVMDNYAFAKQYNQIFPGDTGNYFGPGLLQQMGNYTDPEDSWGYVVQTCWMLHNYRSRAQVHYVLKEYIRALSILKELKSVDWQNYLSDPFARHFVWYISLWVEGLMGASYARLGMRSEALAQVDTLESMRPGEPDNLNRMFSGEVPYYQARIYAILDELERAMQALQQSMEEGRMSEWESFVNDDDIIGLNEYQPYLDLFGLK